MQVKQIVDLLNTVSSEVLGESAVKTEDLKNVVDIGESVFNADKVENYTRTLVDHIGKMVFVSRAYEGFAPQIMMDSWEFGSVLEKVRTELPDVEEDPSWQLQDKQSYDENIFHKPKVRAKFFNDRVAFMIPNSITDIQLKSAFTNAVQMNSFITMIFNSIDTALTLYMTQLIRRVINNFIGMTLQDAGMETVEKAKTKSTTRVVNLLYLYNQKFGTSLTADKCIEDADFIRFAAYKMRLVNRHMSEMSKLFNIGQTDKFTPNDLKHFILLEDFSSAADVYLYSNTFNQEFTKLPKATSIAYWQGTGLDFEYSSTSAIDVITADNHEVKATGILGVLFDHDALAVTNLDRETTTKRNNKARFTNYWYHYLAGYYNDLDENFIVFIAA